jgi:hypothetical protein
LSDVGRPVTTGLAQAIAHRIGHDAAFTPAGRSLSIGQTA